jgi:hypothetical protein
VDDECLLLVAQSIAGALGAECRCHVCLHAGLDRLRHTQRTNRCLALACVPKHTRTCPAQAC